jgi:hypothetical protein
MTKDMLRRLAQLEAENARRIEAERAAGHGLGAEEYARTYAYLAHVLQRHPTNWTLEEMEVMSGQFPQFDFRSAPRDPVA